MSTCLSASRFANGEAPSEAWKKAFLRVNTTGDDMSGVQIVSRAVRKANKEHTCFWCGKIIPKGHHYMTEVGQLNDELIRHDHCLMCLERDAAWIVQAETPTPNI